MYRTEIHRQLSIALREQIDQLIHRTWSFEASESGDVEVLGHETLGVHDPLDQLSLHVIVSDWNGTIVGYGRVAVTQLNDAAAETLRELQFPTYLNAAALNDSIAYISRLVVDPHHRGRGIATIIHKTRIKLATNLGAQAIYGWAVGEKPRNVLSQMGFVEVLEKDGFTTPWYRTFRTARLVRFDLEQVQDTQFQDLPMASSN